MDELERLGCNPSGVPINAKTKLAMGIASRWVQF